MKATARYKAGEVEATFTANAVWDDYGVPGSPRFLTIEDIEIESLTVFGVKLPHKSLVLSALCDALVEAVDEDAFEIEPQDEDF